MSTFKDREGREWTLDINLDSVEQVRKETNVSIYELTNDRCKPLAELMSVPPILANVCYILVGAKEAGVDQRTFATSIKGPEFEAMTEAFQEELMLFFQGPRQEALRTVWAGAKAAQRKSTEKIKLLDPEKLADHLLTQIGSTTSGALLDSLAFSPAKSHP